MHKYAHFWKSSRRWRPQFPSLFYFFALVSEEPSPQCMCNVCTIQQHQEMEPGLNLWPVTRSDPDAFWPGDPTRSLSVCALNWEIILTTVCYKWMLSAKSLCSMQHTDDENVQHNRKFIQYWKVKTINSAIADKPRDAFRGQSYVRYGFLLVCYSNIVQIFNFKKCRDLEIRVRGH